MAIKRTGASPKITLKRGTPTPEDYVTKDALVGRTFVVELKDFDPEYLGNYGVQPRAIVNLIDLDSEERINDFWAYGAMAKNIGQWLQPGELGLGTVITGVSKNGKDFYGVNWIEDDEVFVRAQAILAKSETVPF